MVKASPTVQAYFNSIEAEVKKSYKVASAARKKGLDPEDEPPIPVARNMAERVVGLISVVAPQIINTKITDRIIELEKEYGLLDWRVGFKIAEEVAKQQFCTFETKLEAMEVGIRVGFAYLTLGIVSAPLEGFIGLKLKKRHDGKEYFALQYAGPIRAAGGTAASTSVILCDYVRVKMGYAPWDPTDKEISRYMTDVNDYHERVTNLQYRPSDQELKFLISKLPVEVDGDPTEKREVSNYKDIPRIETNMIRGGVALVLAEGVAQKAPKLWKRLAKWGKDFDLEWEWMEEFLKIKEEVHAQHGAKKEKKKTEKKTVKPNNTFIMDIVAGRPIFTHPMAIGGFRLRYGRNRNTGFSTAGTHPATMQVVENFLAVGTQLKNERPGKGATVVACDTIEGPIVKLIDGTVTQLHSMEEEKNLHKDIEEILFLGDILFNYGDFSENGHGLVPAGYCPEWWALEVEKALQEKKTSLQQEKVEELVKNPLNIEPTFDEALLLSQELDIAMHPNYTFYWKCTSAQLCTALFTWFRQAKIKKDQEKIIKIILPLFNEEHKKAKRTLEEIGVSHLVINKEQVVIEKSFARSLALALGITTQKGIDAVRLPKEEDKYESALDIIKEICPIKQKDKAGTFIGARMGRPEKAKMRQLTGAPQVMFPVGEEGDRLRSFQAALQAKKITSAFAHYWCETCKKDSIYRFCEECDGKTLSRFYCKDCGTLEKEECRHGKARPYMVGEIDINYYFEKAKKRIGEKLHPDLIKGVRGTSNKNHIVEHLAKGILRAKHKIYVNKEGTTRYDCTELPITHFKPKEIHTSVEKLRTLGYLKDMHGKELVNDNQILEIFPQDVILPGFDSLEESAPQVLLRVAKFIDELLVKFYKIKPFYNAKTFEDLAGHLVIGLAPHISAGLVGRIIGYSKTQGLITHPMYHAGMRRDCVHPTTRFVYEWNGSVYREKIGSFVENLLKKGAKTKNIDKEGTVKVPIKEKLYAYSIDPISKKQVKRKIKYFIKSKQPTHWVKITTATNRELYMTPTHDFLYLDDQDKIVFKKANEAKTGDKIPLLNLINPKTDDLLRIREVTYDFKKFEQVDKKLKQSGDILIDFVKKVEKIADPVPAYCFEVEWKTPEERNVLWGKQIINTRCDGDEAAVLLLMDGLLNFSRQYLPERRGAKSVPPTTLIYYKHEGKIISEEIGKITDKLLEENKESIKTDEDYEILKIDGYQAISFDAETKKVGFFPISKFIRHESPKHIYKITTSHGELEVTGDHSIFVTKGKEIIEKEVRDLEEGEALICLGKINFSKKRPKKIDLCKLIPNEVYLMIDSEQKKKIKSLKKEKLLEIKKKWGNNYYRYLSQERKAPLQFLYDCGFTYYSQEVSPRNGTTISRYILINEHFIRLCAYVIAEGHIKEKRAVEITNTDKAIVQEIVQSIKEVTGKTINPSWSHREGKKPCARIRLPSLIREVLIKYGIEPVKAGKKTLPSFIYTLSNELKEVFLDAYIKGDGHYYSKKNFTMLYTKSPYLAAGLSLLAHSLNKKTSINKGTRSLQVLYSDYNNTDPWWPLQEYTKELYSALRKEGFVRQEISKILANYRKNTRTKNASKEGIKKIINLLQHKENKLLKEELKQIIQADIRVERVRKIEKYQSPYKYVYDLEVPEHQNFLCGPHPIFAHNTMDAPLVLTSILNPTEIDDQAHGIDVEWRYPLEFYEAALEMKNPWEVKYGKEGKKIAQLGDRLGTEKQYEDFGFTHQVDNINKAPLCSAYKTLPSMVDKLDGQMLVAKKVRAVDMDDVARLTIQKHFLRDIKGNFRKFSSQKFRCGKCNAKYARPPLVARCTECNGKLIFTISEGSVVKYLKPSIVLADKYNFSPYLKQTIDMLKNNIDHVFGKEKDKQVGLSAFMGGEKKEA